MLNVIDKFPTYGYLRVGAILHRQSKSITMINAKRVYHIMKESAYRYNVNYSI
ncbi:hypothetical protein [Providencia stuartii]|uniref:hypothetical protein n=1 Tax=Providencia stuartii TaxID=588 RepID=UPI0038501064